MDIHDQRQTPSRRGQWQKIKALPEEIISEIESYFLENHFSLEVRDFLAEWIESQPWSSIPDEDTAKHYLSEMVSQIKRCAENQHFSIQRTLEKAAKKIEERYGNEPLKFKLYIEEILNKEHSFLEQYREKDNDPSQQLIQTPDWMDYLKQFESLSQEIQGKINDAKSSTSDLFYAENTKPERKKHQIRKGQDLNALKTENSKESLEKTNEILKESLCFLGHMHTQLKDTTKEILDKDLQNWIRKQRLYGNSSETDEINKIQKWCSKIASLICVSQQQIKEISQLQQTDYSELNASFTQLYHKLVRRTFIVSEQPPQIMKVNNRMLASVCLLSGEALNINSNPPTVTAELISQKERKGTLMNNTSTMQFVQNQYIATFRKMKLTEVIRSKIKSGECVTEEKFALNFSMKVQIGEEELRLWVLSLPVVVIVNVNQESKANATILWDNYFADHVLAGGTEVPQTVLWSQCADMLNYKFTKDIGVSLKSEDLKYFAFKIFDETIGDLSTMCITWDQFCKRNMKDKKFAFWDWFYAIEKLIQSYFLDLYKDNLVIGFVEKVPAGKMLLRKQSGTFLLRFSDNQLGGISVARRGSKDVKHTLPFTSDQLKNYTLANIILNQKKLLYLYPDMPKIEAFQKYGVKNTGTEQFMENHGYEKFELNLSLESDSDNEQTNCDTPSSQNEIPEDMDTETFFFSESMDDFNIYNIPPRPPDDILS